jgi:hypothetical protein
MRCGLRKDGIVFARAPVRIAGLADDRRAVPSPDSAGRAAISGTSDSRSGSTLHTAVTHLCTKIDAMMHRASPATIVSDAAAMSEIPVATAVSCVERDQFM